MEGEEDYVKGRVYFIGGMGTRKAGDYVAEKDWGKRLVKESYREGKEENRKRGMEARNR